MSFQEKEIDFCQKNHIDYDQIDQIFYENIYFEISDVVLKIPLMSLIKQISNDDIKIEKFDITKYTYLLHHE